jgi:hypothetical protein
VLSANGLPTLRRRVRLLQHSTASKDTLRDGGGRVPVDKGGRITLRVNGRMHHIGLGTSHSGARVLVLVRDVDVRVIDAASGELIRVGTLITLDAPNTASRTGDGDR